MKHELEVMREPAGVIAIDLARRLSAVLQAALLTDFEVRIGDDLRARGFPQVVVEERSRQQFRMSASISIQFAPAEWDGGFTPTPERRIDQALAAGRHVLSGISVQARVSLQAINDDVSLVCEACEKTAAFAHRIRAAQRQFESMLNERQRDIGEAYLTAMEADHG